MIKSIIDLATAEVQEATKQLEQKQQELGRIQSLSALYPDIHRREGRWKKVVLSSAMVNSKVTDVSFRYNCGCCDDSPLEAWLYLKTEYGDVYSDPPYFVVGERNYIGGDNPFVGLKQSISNMGIPEQIAEIIQARFDREHGDE